MKQNKYDDPDFFANYAGLQRSLEGLAAAGEWPDFRDTLPELAGKRVLDLGCGYGWHCRYAAEQGAELVVGIDLSKQMIARARELTQTGNIEFQQSSIEDFQAPAGSFDVVLSSLALHYVPDLAATCLQVARLLDPGGHFCYSVEHPIFTANAAQEWFKGEDGRKLHWPVDDYFDEGERSTRFLGADVVKYHRTISAHFKALRTAGFNIDSLLEPTPPADLIARHGWQDELRRPMMLIIGARVG